MKPLFNKIIATGILGAGLVLGSCGSDDNKKAQEDTAKVENIGEALDYSLKFTVLKAYKQYQELDSLENLYDSLDKKSDTLVSFWKKKIIN